MGRAENGLPSRGRTTVRLPGLQHRDNDMLTVPDYEGK
jgi:hypothetical protein